MADTLLKSLTRDLNCLKESNKQTRKRAIESIKKQTTGNIDPQILKDVLNEIAKPVLTLWSDPAEKCRELSIMYIDECFDIIEDPCDYLPLVFPLLVQRLGQQDILEPSEEVRLLSIQLIHKLIKQCRKNIGPFVDDIAKILQRTIQDPCPDIKKESCSCARLAASTVPAYFHMQSESLINPLLHQLTHQHSKVRSETVLTLGDVIQYGSGKMVPDVVPHLAQRMFDQMPCVRAAVNDVVGKWLLDLPDRYSFHYQLIPLLFTSFSDEMPNIQQEARDYWRDIGLKYEGENEEDLKDKLNFEKEKPRHYPPNLERQSLGCRMLLYYNYSKMVKGIKNDVSDWVADTRLKSIQLLYHLLTNEEDNVTQHLQDTLECLYKAANNEEGDIQQWVIKSAELIGYFVPPSNWVPMALKYISLTKSSLTCAGNVMVLAAILRGSEKETLAEYFLDIAEGIMDPEISNSLDPRLQHHLLGCVSALITVYGDDVREISKYLFSVNVRVLGLTRAEVVSAQAQQTLLDLASAQAISRQDLFDAHTLQTLSELKTNYTNWNQNSLERIIFNSLLYECGPVIGDILDEIMPIFEVNLNTDKDPEVRLKFFGLIGRLLINAPQTFDSKGRFKEYSGHIIKDLILPNLVWKAGRTAGTVRTAALSCLWSMVKSKAVDKEQLEPLSEPLMVQLWGVADDDNMDTRLLTLRVITHVMETLGDVLDKENTLYNAYPHLLKRLDDANDSVRVAACRVFVVYFGCFKGGYEVSSYKGHLQEIYKGLLIHLNDPSEKIQNAVLEILQKCVELEPNLLLNEIHAVKETHRTTKYCDILEQKIKELRI